MPELIHNNVEENVAECPVCGATYFIGEWPVCPHGRGCYSFALKGKGWTGKTGDKRENRT